MSYLCNNAGKALCLPLKFVEFKFGDLINSCNVTETGKTNQKKEGKKIRTSYKSVLTKKNN